MAGPNPVDMIAIRVVSRAGEPLASPLVARFGDAGGDIGRGADCTLVLPDPERRISRKHLQVTLPGGRPQLRLISTNLNVELDGVPLAPGAEYPLADGSQIRIGPFVLQVRDEQAAPRAAPAAAGPEPGVPAPAAARPGLFHDLLGAPDATPPALGGVDLLLGEGGTDERAAHAHEGDADAARAPYAALYAGLAIAPPVEPAPAQAKLVGALLREAVAGTLSLLATRTIAKRELGTRMTMPQTGENNPLKFAGGVDTALAHLLGPPQRGFLAPMAALQGAYADLRAHELALLAGMRAALAAVLARFDPQVLEARLDSRGVWENLVPVHHKARLWDRYAEQHAELMREVEDDFDALFADAFIEAYEQQMAQLRRPAPR